MRSAHHKLSLGGGGGGKAQLEFSCLQKHLAASRAKKGEEPELELNSDLELKKPLSRSKNCELSLFPSLLGLNENPGIKEQEIARDEAKRRAEGCQNAAQSRENTQKTCFFGIFSRFSRFSSPFHSFSSANSSRQQCL